MKLKLSNIFILGLTLTIFSLSAERVLACDCMRPGSVKYEKERAAAVFVGEVISVKPVNTGSFNQTELKVIKTWNGAASSQIIIATGKNNCGYLFETGKSYLIYAYNNGQILVTGLCTRTTVMGTRKAKQEMKLLDKLVRSAGVSPALSERGN